MADEHAVGGDSDLEQLKARLHRRLVSELDPDRIARMDKTMQRAMVEETIQNLLNNMQDTVVQSRSQRARLVAEL